MNLLSRFLSRTEFKSYDDFKNNFKINVPERFNFAYDVVDVYAEADPEKKALVWCDDKGVSETFTFKEMKELSSRAANLFKKAGIKKGDPVMLVLKGRHEFWPCILALHKLGAIAIPATHMLKEKDIVYRIKRADIKMVVSVNDKELLDHVDSAQKQCPDILKVKVSVGGNREGWIDYDRDIKTADPELECPTGSDAAYGEDIMLLYFTSGTTGMPKMVQHNFTYPLGHILTAGYWQNVIDDGLHYTVADTGWAKAVWGKIYGQWIAGSAVFVYDYEKFSAVNLLKKATEHGVSTFCAPPTVYRFLIREDLSRYDLSSLKYFVTAGEPLNPEVYNKILEHTGIKLMEGYGQTEMTVAVGTYPWMEPKPGSMGKPSPCYPIELINLEGRPCETGEEGEIVLHTAQEEPVGMFDGYYRDHEITHQAWNEGYYHTGDTAWKDEDGYLWFVGRTDDIIKSSGYRIGPFEVESALIQHPAVLECAVTGVSDPVRGQVVKATIVLTKEYSPDENLKKELQDHVKKITAPYKYPRLIEFVPQLPKTISGKIRRVAIRNKDTDRQDK